MEWNRKGNCSVQSKKIKAVFAYTLGKISFSSKFWLTERKAVKIDFASYNFY